MKNIQHIEDASLATFLSLRGLKITPQRQPSGRIFFFVDAPQETIRKTIEELYEDPPIGALSFIQKLKSLRCAIFALKN